MPQLLQAYFKCWPATVVSGGMEQISDVPIMIALSGSTAPENKQTVGDQIKHWNGTSCGSGKRGRKCLAGWAVGQGDGSYSGGEWI